MKNVGTPMGSGHLMPFNSTLLSIANHMAPNKQKAPPKAKGQGRKRVNAKLTPGQVLEVLDRRARGQTAMEISNRMKVSNASVHGVIYNGNGARTLGK